MHRPFKLLQSKGWWEFARLQRVGGTAGLPQIWGWGKLFGFDGDRPYCLTCVVSVRSGALELLVLQTERNRVPSS